MIRIYIVLFTLLLPLCSAFSAPNQSATSSYEGRHFLVGFMDNEINDYSPPYMVIYISSKYNTEVTITEPQSSKTYSVNLKKDSVINISVQSGYEHIQSEFIQRNMLIEISSTYPISCVAKSSIPQSGDTYSIIPTRNWGLEHYAVSMPNDYYIKDSTGNSEIYYDRIPRLGEFLVLANDDNTNVEIKVAAETLEGTPKDSIINVRLNKGQSYLVKSKYVYQHKGIHDLTGSRIRSDKPVGVVSGHMRTAIYQQEEYNTLDSKDHIAEMMPPTNAWSNQYISLPFGNGIKSMFKVVAKDTLDLTFINDFNVNTVSMLPGDFLQFDNIDLATHWVANGKFMLTQFMAKRVWTPDIMDYDPAMVIVPSLDKMVSKTTYFASNSYLYYFDGQANISTYQYISQSVIILADEDAKNSIRVNNYRISDNYTFNEIDANGKKYYWKKVPLEQSPHVVNIVADSGEFNAIAIANGRYDSYAMTVGSSLFAEEEMELFAPVTEVVERCDGFDVVAYDSLITSVSGINVVEVDPVKTANINWIISPIGDSTTNVNITGTVIDKNFDASFKCTIIDYFGNSTEYEYQRPGALVKYTRNINYNEVNVNQDTCITFVLKTDADSLLLESIDLPSDLRLDLKVPFSLPKMLYKDKDHYFIICLMNEKGNLNAVKDSIMLNFACNFQKKIDLNAAIISFELSAEGLSLPKILGGTSYDTKADEYVAFRNVGNAPITADSVLLPVSPYFTVDTTGMFPVTLQNGDSIVFNKIHFTHSISGTYNYVITLMDSKNINRTATIVGSVGTPLIKDVVLDFGNTRIGSYRDSIVNFTNSGDFFSIFNLVEVQSNVPNDPNIDVIQLLGTINIRETETYPMKFSYNPTDVLDFNPYRLEAKFVERWAPHDTINLVIIGQPTLPNITTVNIDMDTVKIFENRDSLVKVIFSTGNEKLKIKRISKLSGDNSVFIFDNSFYDERDIDYPGVETLNLRFEGLTLGPQSMQLLVESDAAPNYASRLDTINIIGFVREQDTLSLQVSPENLIITSCNYDTLNLQVTNTGNTSFRIEDININTTFSYTSLIDKTLGDTLNPRQSITKKILVFSSGNRTDDIYYDIKVRDLTQDIDSVLVAHSTVESRQQQIIIEPFGASNIDIGEFFEVAFKGTFPNTIDTSANLHLELNVDTYNFFLDEDKAIIYFYDMTGNIVKEVEVKVRKASEKLIFESEKLNNFDFTGIIRWEFKLKFLALLTTDLDGSMELVFNTSDCYTGNSLSNILDVNQVCAYRFRNIDLNSLYLEANLLPNIISNEANLEVEAYSEQSGSLYLMDYLGKKYSIMDKILFDKGKNNIILNLSDYPNGKYILVVQTNSTTLTKEIIIIK